MLKKLFLSIALCTLAAAMTCAQLPSAGDRWISYTELGVLVGNPDNEDATPFTFQSSLNYAFRKHLSAGIGIGFDFLSETYMPLTANLMYRMKMKHAVAPFIRLQAGYQVALENKTFSENIYRPVYDLTYYSSIYPYYPTTLKFDSRGGFLASPSVGIHINTKSGLGIALAAGYRYQQLHYSGDNDYEMQIEYNRLSLTIGIIF
jgi:hypothetical protein